MQPDWTPAPRNICVLFYRFLLLIYDYARNYSAGRFGYFWRNFVGQSVCRRWIMGDGGVLNVIVWYCMVEGESDGLGNWWANLQSNQSNVTPYDLCSYIVSFSF